MGRYIFTFAFVVASMELGGWFALGRLDWTVFMTSIVYPCIIVDDLKKARSSYHSSTRFVQNKPPDLYLPHHGYHITYL